MRLHGLEITAFGPFAETVRVDFDRLSAAGLFLLSGPTGAGKTSVLDAVCFALYGDVPGDRNAARRLRSDHAAPGVAPRVSLEATLSGRRFRIVRSPAWERPKKRGTGTTTQQASVTISEHLDGGWVPLSSRLDETGHLVTRLVGMNVTQFTQVAMLPQGRFQSFLRARSEERHKLLQQLFRTGRFEDVERWLREHRTTLRRRSETTHRQVADLASRISEATSCGLPDGWDIRDLHAPAGSGELLAWAEELRAVALTERTAADDEAADAADTERAARDVLEQGRALAARRTRLAAAARELAGLEETAGQHECDRARLDAGRRAAAVAPVHRMARAAAGALTRAARSAEEAGAAAADELGLLLVDPETLAGALEEAVDAAARVRALLPREREVLGLDAEIESARRRRERAASRRAVVAERRAALPDRLGALRADLEQARAASLAVAGVESRLADVRRRVGAAEQVRVLRARLDVAEAELLVISQTAILRREQWLDLREARLDGMAAEIAGALAVGACCPVCGSADHPQKARAALDAPDAVAEKEALRLLDDAKSEEQARAGLVRDLTTRLSLAREHAGDEEHDVLRGRLDELRGERDALAARAGHAPALARRLEATEEERDRLAAECGDLDLEVATQDDALRSRGSERDALQAELDAVLAGARDLAARLAAHQARIDVARAALRALEEAAAATRTAVEAEAALRTAAAEAGFADVTGAADALLDPAALGELERRVAAHEQRLAAVTAVLEEPGAAGDAAAPPPDLPVLEQQHAQALSHLGAARSRSTLWGGRAERLAVLVDRLAAVLEQWRPLRESLELATRLAAFVDGKSADNALQMRLSAYVLAYRLSQVVAAANERLSRMSDRRYALEHTGRRGAGETRGGLSLAVRDAWSGHARDPATLSGGETFVVSLALALGLADVITQESDAGDGGDSRLDTLFVDEGFGSLDADTLDDVMDVLDSLRDGGRVVGVVSHVAEMRDRIPAQLRVGKSREGSTVAVSR